MGVDTETESIRDGAVEGFGRVSRTVGTVFRYVLLAATLFGIVMLGVLLVFVANDAIQPLTADLGWHLTGFVTLIVPTVSAGIYLYWRNTAAFTLGVGVLGLGLVSLMFSGGIAMVFIDIVPPLVWFAFVVAFALPTALVMGIERFDRRLPFFARFVATVILFYLSLFGLSGPIGAVLGLPQLIPSVVTLTQHIPVPVERWMYATLALGGSVAAIIALYAQRSSENDAGRVGEYLTSTISEYADGRFGGVAARVSEHPAGVIAGISAFFAVVLIATIGPFVGLDPLSAVVVASVSIVPTGAYVIGSLLTRERDRIGLLLPGVIFGGTLVGKCIVELVGFTGPHSWVDWQFLTSTHSSSSAAEAGLYPAIGGSILLMVTVAVLSFPLGVGAAIYLEEYASDSIFTRIIDINISNLAGVPSVVYGLLGLAMFVTHLGQPMGTVLVGGATLAVLILPIVIISSREAIRSVPEETRQASYGMGATRWQTVKNVVLPRAFPGILTGTILALGRAIGETAPLIMIGAADVVYSLPTQFSSAVSAMPLQLYLWAGPFAKEEYFQKALPAGVIVIIVVLLAMNSMAIVLRNKYKIRD